MKGPLLAMIAIGTLVGIAMPSRAPAPAAAVETEPAHVVTAQRPVRTAAAPTGPGAWGGELRLRPRANGHFYATASVNGQPIAFVVDTGATTVALTVDDARRAGIAVDPSRFDVVGTGASGPIRGHEIEIRTIALDGKEARGLTGVVLDGLEVSLLGQTYLSRLQEVRMAGGEMILR